MSPPEEEPMTTVTLTSDTFQTTVTEHEMLEVDESAERVS
jgi:hypothetical protein